MDKPKTISNHFYYCSHFIFLMMGLMIVIPLAWPLSKLMDIHSTKTFLYRIYIDTSLKFHRFYGKIVNPILELIRIYLTLDDFYLYDVSLNELYDAHSGNNVYRHKIIRSEKTIQIYGTNDISIKYNPKNALYMRDIETFDTMVRLYSGVKYEDLPQNVKYIKWLEIDRCQIDYFPSLEKVGILRIHPVDFIVTFDMDIFKNMKTNNPLIV